MSGFCPRNIRGCIGVYKRNVITWKSTILWLLLWVGITFFDVAYKIIFINVSKWSAKTLFWVWNIPVITVVEGFHLILPLFIDVPEESERTKVKKMFYVTRRSLEPRRPHSQSPTFECQSTSRGRLQHVKNSNTQTNNSVQLRKIYPCTLYCKLHNNVVRTTDKNTFCWMLCFYVVKFTNFLEYIFCSSAHCLTLNLFI